MRSCHHHTQNGMAAYRVGDISSLVHVKSKNESRIPLPEDKTDDFYSVKTDETLTFVSNSAIGAKSFEGVEYSKSPGTEVRKGKKRKDSRIDVSSTDQGDQFYQTGKKKKKTGKNKIPGSEQGDEVSNHTEESIIGDGQTSSFFDGDSESDQDISPKKTSRRKKGKITDEEEALRSKRTLFVGNLPASVKEKGLKKLFSSYGKIESIRFRSAAPVKSRVPKKVAVIKRQLHAEKNNLNAYLVFKDDESIAKALELNGYVIDGHHIRVDCAGGSGKPNHKYSVFVGNLAFNVGEEDIWNFFSDAGDVESVRVVRDKNTGAGKGFGFVTFKNKNSVSLAIELDGKELLERHIRVSMCKKPGLTKVTMPGKGRFGKGGKDRFQKPISKEGFRGEEGKKLKKRKRSKDKKLKKQNIIMLGKPSKEK